VNRLVVILISKWCVSHTELLFICLWREQLDNLASRPIFFPHLRTLSVQIEADVSVYWLYRVLDQCRDLRTLRVTEINTAQSIVPEASTRPPRFQLERLVVGAVEGFSSELLDWILSSNDPASCVVSSYYGWWPSISIDTISALTISELNVGWPLYTSSELWTNLPNVKRLRIFQVVIPNVLLVQQSLANLPSLEVLSLGLMSRGLKSIRKAFPPFSSRDNLIQLVSRLSIKELEVDHEMRSWTLAKTLQLDFACLRADINLKWKKIGNAVCSLLAL
jgi:hypothetical protein